jgi:hypothetical protein
MVQNVYQKETKEREAAWRDLVTWRRGPGDARNVWSSEWRKR